MEQSQAQRKQQLQGEGDEKGLRVRPAAESHSKRRWREQLHPHITPFTIQRKLLRRI
jgi:hypothetical protein